MIFQDRWYQKEAVESVFNYFDQGNIGNPVVAMPTGTGKALVIGLLVKRLLEEAPHCRLMMLTHVKKLIEQNAEKCQMVWPTVPLGIYSAGLNERSMLQPVIFAGVQSVYSALKKSEKEDSEKPPQYRHFGWRDIFVIDEAHMLSPEDETMYQYVIGKFKEINPKLVVVGLTATPYRLKQGMITEGGIFTDVCYDITKLSSFNRLIAEGYLAPLIARPTETEIDVSTVGLVGSDFNNKQLDAIVDQEELTYKIVEETVKYGQDRACWIGFATSIEDAEHTAAVLRYFNVNAVAVHSKVEPKENDRRIRDFVEGKITCLVSKDQLTTGFDCPQIDLIMDKRPTMSPALHVQKAGRGTRPAPDKKNCLFLDFARNVPRLGPINDPYLPKRSTKGKAGDAPIWVCPACSAYNHAAARECHACGEEHIFKTKLFSTAGKHDIIKDDTPDVQDLKVQTVFYNLHQKDGSPPMIKVDYVCGLKMFREFVCLEHSGWPGKRSREWWRQRHAEEPPLTTYEALKKISELRMPSTITVHLNKKPYPEILKASWS